MCYDHQYAAANIEKATDEHERRYWWYIISGLDPKSE